MYPGTKCFSVMTQLQQQRWPSETQQTFITGTVWRNPTGYTQKWLLGPEECVCVGGRFVQQNSLFNLIINTSLKWSDENLKQNDFNAPLKGFVLKAPVCHTATSIYACH